jgi:glycosyltransferase involved in cell wall biosynthesis
LAEKILELYRHPEERERITREAQRRSADFTWEGQYKVYLSVVERLLEGEGPASV